MTWKASFILELAPRIELLLLEGRDFQELEGAPTIPACLLAGRWLLHWWPKWCPHCCCGAGESQICRCCKDTAGHVVRWEGSRSALLHESCSLSFFSFILTSFSSLCWSYLAGVHVLQEKRRKMCSHIICFQLFSSLNNPGVFCYAPFQWHKIDNKPYHLWLQI